MSPLKQAGHKKTGGRVKGTPNKTTLVLDSFAQDITEGGMDKFRKELAKLRGAAYVKAYMALFEYVKPKLARTELTGKDGRDLFVPINTIEIVHTQEIPLNGNGATDIHPKPN